MDDEIRINDFDDEFDSYESMNETITTTQDTLSSSDDDVIREYLSSLGVDKSNISIEDEDGSVEGVDWNDLSGEEKLNILKLSSKDPDTDLDEDEIQLINSIRMSKMRPAEYLDSYSKQYAQHATAPSNTPTYQVDDYSDEELYTADLMSRLDLTEDEALEELERARANEAVFKKLVNAIRNEYKQIESENIAQQRLYQQQVQQEQFNRFAGSIVNSINQFDSFGGYNLNMDNDDKQELYEFITGFDAAGNSILGKAMNDPNTLVKMAWFALNGEQMINDITDYYRKEISSSRRKDSNKVVYKNKKSTKAAKSSFDVDDDFE